MSTPEGIEIVVVDSSSEPVIPPPEEPMVPEPEKAPQAAEEVQAGPEGDQEEEESEEEEGVGEDGDCHCRECLMGCAPENWHGQYYDDRDEYDGGYGCDWNESGYFD